MAKAPDYNGNGTKTDDKGGVFADPGTADKSQPDYNTWDWKQIEAAIVGHAATTDTSASAVADPNSLQTAANALYRVQQTLEVVAQALNDQAKGLAGG